MKNRITSVSDQFVKLTWRVAYWLWETIELILIIIFDCFVRLMELILVIMKLMFQVLCFFRDLCIDTMQTFANVFRGIVNVISSISCDDVEDFASACIVIALCTGAVKMFMNLLKRVHTKNRQTRRSAGTLNCSCARLARNIAAV
ncbi:PREDICTED: uncharacterized protein LOC105451405 isoform X2 [Wasmannia auropunctata]|uniref:uncharacterized protein LOC105451405 isoform X2 n=1 Tax=Wasmannia auropunctata TaxID=64793 RepID=UPI0005EED16D|nr:PREDICTED: uncharacterized protein LOC105451405 isoform X2 [Wasmannia auropunctata]